MGSIPFKSGPESGTDGLHHTPPVSLHLLPLLLGERRILGGRLGRLHLGLLLAHGDMAMAEEKDEEDLVRVRVRR